MICGEPAIDSVRAGGGTGGLQIRNSRRRVTRPWRRNWIASAAPSQSPRLFLQTPLRPQSSSACFQALQPPETKRTRNQGVPEPCQCTPTMLKWGAETARERAVACSGTSWTTIVTGSAASAFPPERTSNSAASRRTRTRTRFQSKGHNPAQIQSLRLEALGACAGPRGADLRAGYRRCDAEGARDPLRHRGEPCHAGLPLAPAPPGGEAALR